MQLDEFTFHLKLLRKSKGFAQQAVAEKLGVSSRTYQRLEYGELEPSLSILKNVAVLFEMSLPDFLSLSRGISANADEDTIDMHFDEQKILYKFLGILLENIPRDEALDKGLNTILKSTWLPIESRGGVFLVSDKKSKTLDLTVTSEKVSPELKTVCAQVDFGQCLCGRAASAKEILFTDCVDEKHELGFKGMGGHGHYNVPFFNNNDELLGVIVLYVKEGHESRAVEVEFLKHIAIGFGIICEKYAQGNVAKAMAVTLCHEINNPLTIALSMIDKVIPNGESQEEKFIKIKGSLERIRDVMEELRDIDMNSVKFESYSNSLKMIKLNSSTSS